MISIDELQNLISQSRELSQEGIHSFDLKALEIVFDHIIKKKGGVKMGITIHYRGQLKSPDLIDTFCRELQAIANLMEWKYTVLDEDFEKPTDARLTHNEKGCEITGHLAIKGINLDVHKGCSDIGFFFDSNGILRDPVEMASRLPGETIENNDLPFSFVKTQYATPEIHITLIKLLRYLDEKYFQTFEVNDEGGYWETGDENALKEKMKFLDHKLNVVAKALEESWLPVEPGDTALDVLVKIEKVLREL